MSTEGSPSDDISYRCASRRLAYSYQSSSPIILVTISSCSVAYDRSATPPVSVFCMVNTRSMSENPGDKMIDDELEQLDTENIDSDFKSTRPRFACYSMICVRRQVGVGVDHTPQKRPHFALGFRSSSYCKLRGQSLL